MMTAIKKSSGKNVDFIVQRGLEKPIPIEVSCGKRIKVKLNVLLVHIILLMV